MRYFHLHIGRCLGAADTHMNNPRCGPRALEEEVWGGSQRLYVALPIFQRVGGLDSDQLLQQRAGTAPRPWAGRKCDFSVPSAAPRGTRKLLLSVLRWVLAWTKKQTAYKLNWKSCIPPKREESGWKPPKAPLWTHPRMCVYQLVKKATTCVSPKLAQRTDFNQQHAVAN